MRHPVMEERLAQFELAHGFNEVLFNLGDDVFSDRNPDRGPIPWGG
ncbi:MAG: hypothetical protein LBP33_10305 [Candidatus Adiutrix sp.]|jgi:hypothetical protein|nr:hypothetical protein [Candidatus Adiutrix sp.]